LNKDSLAYLVIHGQGSTFKIFQKNTWKTLSPLSLAKWITDSIAYDGKNIVLLSCSDSVSNQKLANALGNLDKAAQRKIRKVIAWDETVELYENGFIQGSGSCRSFESFNLSTSVVLMPVGIGNLPPQGTPSVLLTPRTPQTDVIWNLASKGATATEIKALLKSWGNFRTNFIKHNNTNTQLIQRGCLWQLFYSQSRCYFGSLVIFKIYR
jgi:hypothetical protein